MTPTGWVFESGKVPTQTTGTLPCPLKKPHILTGGPFGFVKLEATQKTCLGSV